MRSFAGNHHWREKTAVCFTGSPHICLRKAIVAWPQLTICAFANPAKCGILHTWGRTQVWLSDRAGRAHCQDRAAGAFAGSKNCTSQAADDTAHHPEREAHRRRGEPRGRRAGGQARGGEGRLANRQTKLRALSMRPRMPAARSNVSQVICQWCALLALSHWPGRRRKSRHGSACWAPGSAVQKTEQPHGTPCCGTLAAGERQDQARRLRFKGDAASLRRFPGRQTLCVGLPDTCIGHCRPHRTVALSRSLSPPKDGPAKATRRPPLLAAQSCHAAVAASGPAACWPWEAEMASLGNPQCFAR